MTLRYLSLFSGIGGFDLGFDRAGMVCVGQVEYDEKARSVLARHWPDVKRLSDVKEITGDEFGTIDLICGGDPCPSHSRARSNGESNSPDLSGYFLALAGRCTPRWVVRENVPAPTVDHFDAALAALGYGTVVIRMDAAKVTGQLRQRDFIVGRYQATRETVRGFFSDCADGSGTYTTSIGTRPITPALTTHRTRYDSRDCYIYQPGQLRILDAEERETLAGFPRGWTAGLSEAARAKFYGNAVVPQVAEWIGRRIVEVNE
jgi:DNA (cytosine-5)-methyltransferase 1